ncbi:MAG: alpha/beta hydrolase [Chloracidobacterium sp.]|nr:alpha/beta hydrolase [Chloracidobacterium sp.]
MKSRRITCLSILAALIATAFGQPGRLDPKIRKFLESLNASGGEPIYKMSPVDARNVLETLQSQPIKKLDAKIQDLTIPGGLTKEISIRIVRPANNAGAALPVVMYFHGGGWILGSKNTHDRLIREIANGADVDLVFVNYATSPEAKYPVQIEQAYAATKYIAENGKMMNMDSTRLAVAGDSVGGNMATVVALLAKQRGGPRITYQVLFYPVTDANFETTSYREFADGPWLTKSAMKWFWDSYAPEVSARKNPTASPLQASLDELSGLPPALVITDENDVLRDEGEAYADKMMQAGVRVTALRYLGAIHDFVMLNPISDTTGARSAIRLANMNLRIALAGAGANLGSRRTVGVDARR